MQSAAETEREQTLTGVLSCAVRCVATHEQPTATLEAQQWGLESGHWAYPGAGARGRGGHRFALRPWMRACKLHASGSHRAIGRAHPRRRWETLASLRRMPPRATASQASIGAVSLWTPRARPTHRLTSKVKSHTLLYEARASSSREHTPVPGRPSKEGDTWTPGSRLGPRSGSPGHYRVTCKRAI